MDDVLVIGAGPAGLLAAWVARKGGARVCVLAAGIGTTHVSPGWLGILDADGDLAVALGGWIEAHPGHPYALAGIEALHGGISALKQVCEAGGFRYTGDLSDNFLLPTALGALKQAALVPESFAAGDARRSGEMLIAGPAGWRDFYPQLCADNLVRQGISARSVLFDLPEMWSSRFDRTPTQLARLFDRSDVRARVAAQIKPMVRGVARVGLPAVVGLEHSAEACRDLAELLGVPVFEIPTLPPSVPGMRLFNAFKRALTREGVQILLDMTVARGLVEGGQAAGVVVPGAARDTVYKAGRMILATGGLYGGGISSDHKGRMCETVFDLPLQVPGPGVDWFEREFLTEKGHLIHLAGVRSNSLLQPVDADGHVLLENVRMAGRLLCGYNPVIEGSAEGVWLATGYRAGKA